MRITRLSQGVDANRTLQKDALQRSFDVLIEYRTLMDSFNVSSGLLVATSAVRDASNGDNFISRAKEITGVNARVLTGNEEAHFSFSGATAGVAPGNAPIAILDIGGGSTELAAAIDGQLESYSMQLGCVRVTERTLGRGIVSRENETAAKEMIKGEIDRAFLAVPNFEKLIGNVQLMGLAGTVATLAQLEAGLATYDRNAVHLRSLSREDVEKWYETLKAISPEERMSLVGMVPGREDVMASGLLILGAVMDRLEVSQLVSSENDILDGIVASLLGL
jgi:exopolyphosphatase/guanosine-5'-triphosphate,3'-diphosphate pyrophosphatase